MTLLVIDLHEKAMEEADKIYGIVKNYAKTEILRLFNSAGTGPNIDNLSHYDGIILSGSDKRDLLETEEIMNLGSKLRKATDNGTSVLGICAGHEALAECYSYKVVRVSPEVGWPEVYLTEKGSYNLLLRGLPKVIRPFQVHDKAVKGVEGDKILANNMYTQAVVYQQTDQSAVFGFQGHPEETIESGKTFLKMHPKYRKLGGVVRPLSSFSTPAVYVEWKILLNFVDMVNKKSREVFASAD